MSKVNWQRPHRRLVTPRDGEWIRPIPTPPSNTWLLGRTGVSTPNGISSGSAVFCTAQKVKVK